MGLNLGDGANYRRPWDRKPKSRRRHSFAAFQRVNHTSS